MQIFTKRTFLLTAKILGGIIFLFYSLLFFIYWNWPFTAQGGRKYFPFIAIAIYLAGYLIALWKGNWGGLFMIASAVMFSLSPFLYLTSGEIMAKVLFVTIACLPTAIAGILFILSSKPNFALPANQHPDTSSPLKEIK